MRKIVILSFVLTSVLGYGQKSQDELAVVAKVKEEVLVTKSVFVVPTIDLKTSVEIGFETANAKLIAQYFAANIDVSLLDKENLYSKPQAEQVLKTFFLENKPSKFTIIHQGKSSTTQYYIGLLKTEKGDFRITVNVKMMAKKEFISHLTIESES